MYWLFRIFFSFAIILYSVLSTWSRSFLWPPSRTLLQKAFSLECLLKVFSTHIHTHTQLQKVFSLECLLKVLSMVSFYLFTCSDFSEVLCSEVPSWSWIMRGTSSKKSLFFFFSWSWIMRGTSSKKSLFFCLVDHGLCAAHPLKSPCFLPLKVFSTVSVVSWSCSMRGTCVCVCVCTYRKCSLQCL
jgi:hypothetical protein